MKSKILVTGADGQLGMCIKETATRYGNYEFLFTDVAQLDITDRGAVRAYLEAEKPAWVINAAAYTDVDIAEKNPERAFLLNATAAGLLAEEGFGVGASIVHISTDYVFAGDRHTFLTEESTVTPLSVYGKSKLEGERLVAAANPRHFIIRTSWMYSKYGRNFVKTMRELGATGKEVRVVADQWGSPTSGLDLAGAIMTVVASADGNPGKEQPYGLYHYANEGSTCWADFAQVVMDFSGLDCSVTGITTGEYPSDVPRPAFSVLDKSKFGKTFKTNIPEWEDSLEKVIESLEAAE